MHALFERLVDAGEQHEDFHLANEIFWRSRCERTGPRQSGERPSGSIEHHLRAELDDFVPPPIDDPEHQRRAVVIRRHDGAAAEEQ